MAAPSKFVSSTTKHHPHSQNKEQAWWFTEAHLLEWSFDRVRRAAMRRMKGENCPSYENGDRDQATARAQLNAHNKRSERRGVVTIVPLNSLKSSNDVMNKTMLA